MPFLSRSRMTCPPRLPTALFALTALAVGLAAGSARADFLIYKMGGSGMEIVLQGRVQVNPGRTVSFFHPAVKEPLYFSLESVEIKKTLTTQQEFNRQLVRADKDKDAEGVFKAAVWALKKGLLREYYNGVKKTLEINPQHEAALSVMKLKEQMEKDLPEDPKEEAELRRICKRSGMRIARSKHFVLLHDTGEKARPGKKKTRAMERLDLLEQVYESFLLLFYSQDVDLDVPRERMRVILFNNHKDYLEFATSLSPTLVSASGFWEPERNVSVFYDHGTDRGIVVLQGLLKSLQSVADEAKRSRGPGTAEVVRFVNTLKLLIEIERENSDITVVSHEATHQMAGNTGLFPRSVLVPSWVHEGLATYFESPKGAVWAGIGAVNEERLNFYRALESDKEHSNIDFIVGDQIFDFAASHGAKLHGYGQAWALTHFLLENHLKEFVTYYRMLGEMPPDVQLNPVLLTELFDTVFGKDRAELDSEWRSYMRTLKTDMERLDETER